MGVSNLSTKRVQIDKANLTVVVAVSVATFVTVLSLFIGKALLSQRAYQAKMIAKQQLAKTTLKGNLDAEKALVDKYQKFVAQSPNMIGGTPTGTGDRDGDNAKIILDALPSKYDFPALVSSLEKIASDNGTPLDSLSGTDDETNQQNTAKTGVSAEVQIPFQVTVTGNFDAVQKLVDVFQRSIRPINISSLTLSGKDTALSMNISAKTYYQPDVGLHITTEVLK